MSLTVRCKECDHMLYSGPFTKRSGKSMWWKVTSIRDVADMNDEKCPNCGRFLDPSKANVIGVVIR